MLTFEQIKELIQEVADRGLEGLEVERSGFRLKIDGHKAAAQNASPPAAAPAPAPAASAEPPTPASAPAPSPAPTAPPAFSSQESDESDQEHPEGAHVLTSPIVGTFYRRPSPDADPYATVGDRVKEGQVLCIVEAMKLMNEIEADVAGEVLEIIPDDAQPVEYGEPLFVIQPD